MELWMLLLFCLPVVGMAFAITNAAIGASDFQWDGAASNRGQLVDMSAGPSTLSTFISTFTSGAVRNVRATIWIKSFSAGSTGVGGSGTVSTGPLFELMVADNAAFSTNARTLAAQFSPRTANCMVLNGVVPDNFLAIVWRIRVTQVADRDGCQFDANIDAA